MWLNTPQLAGGDVRNLVRGEELKLKTSEADFLRFSINTTALYCVETLWISGYSSLNSAFIYLKKVGAGKAERFNITVSAGFCTLY